MKSKSHNKISKEPLNSLNKEKTFKPPKILGEENHAKPTNILNNLDLLRGLVIYRTELAFGYIHILGQEPFDEI
tara:strand:- start:58 stop:279 length:222 start_codon:yes stop_codon:yes gene_type:complete